MRQERILLGLVEPVDLVDKEDGAACGLMGSRDDLADFLDPLVTAENAMKWDFVALEMIRASVVLPEPGGPQRMIDDISSRVTASRMNAPSPTRCSCPTNSSSVSGRMRSASGAFFGADGVLPSSKRSSGSATVLLPHRKPLSLTHHSTSCPSFPYP